MEERKTVVQFVNEYHDIDNVVIWNIGRLHMVLSNVKGSEIEEAIALFDKYDDDCKDALGYLIEKMKEGGQPLTDEKIKETYESFDNKEGWFIIGPPGVHTGLWTIIDKNKTPHERWLAAHEQG